MLDDDLEDDEDYEGDSSCPFCGEECWNNEDGGHLLASLDQDWREGNFYVGLVGGELYDVDEIGELFRRVLEETAELLCQGKDPRQAEYSWLGEHRATLSPLIEHLASTHVPRAELLSSKEEYGSSDGALLQHVERLADVLQGALAKLVEHTQATEIESTSETFDSMPGHSYNSREWWCSHARDSAQALRKLLRTTLDAPSS